MTTWVWVKMSFSPYTRFSLFSPSMSLACVSSSSSCCSPSFSTSCVSPSFSSSCVVLSFSLSRHHVSLFLFLRDVVGLYSSERSIGSSRQGPWHIGLTRVFCHKYPSDQPYSSYLIIQYMQPPPIEWKEHLISI